jgi:hypothetical protein
MGLPTTVIPFKPTPHAVVRTARIIKEKSLIPFLFYCTNLDTDEENVEETILVQSIVPLFRDAWDNYLFHWDKKTKGPVTYHVAVESLEQVDLIDIAGSNEKERKIVALAKTCLEIALEQGHKQVVWPLEWEDYLLFLDEPVRNSVSWIIMEPVQEPLDALMDMCVDDAEKLDEFVQDRCNDDIVIMMDKVEEATGLYFKPQANMLHILGVEHELYGSDEYEDDERSYELLRYDEEQEEEDEDEQEDGDEEQEDEEMYLSD